VPVIAVSYSALSSLVGELAGDQARVVCIMPNGLDPHEWEPSAQDIAVLSHADLVVCNGLGLEAGMARALERAEAGGVPVFQAAAHARIRHVRAGEGLPTGDPDQAEGAPDPHLWLSPTAMKSVLEALSAELGSRFGLKLDQRLAALERRIDALDADIRARAAALPLQRRLLVTGHESLGYFAEHFGFTLVGAIVPGLSSQSQVSAAGLAALKDKVRGKPLRVLFTELGTPPRLAESLARELGIRVVPITTHALPPGGSWFDLMSRLADAIIGSLSG
jgi:zinc/manganese transport system substrate-binding protein